jgi:hypothetical protein
MDVSLLDQFDSIKVEKLSRCDFSCLLRMELLVWSSSVRATYRESFTCFESKSEQCGGAASGCQLTPINDCSRSPTNKSYQRLMSSRYTEIYSEVELLLLH